MSWIPLTIILCSAAPVGPPPAPAPPHSTVPSLKDLPLFPGGSVDALAGSLRGYLVHNLPTPLYEKSWNWGHTARVANGVKWRGQGLGVHPEMTHTYKNHGIWRKIVVTADNLPNTLVLDIRDVNFPEAGRMTFKVFVSFDTHLDYQQQNWRAGTRTYAGSAEASVRLKLLLDFEASAAVEAGATLLPEAVFRLHVMHADLAYDNLRVLHIAGIGGEGAKLLGDAVKGSLRQWRPALEQELLAKADRAIVKAGDTKEIRLGLSRIFSAHEPKAPTASPAKTGAGK